MSRPGRRIMYNGAVQPANQMSFHRPRSASSLFGACLLCIAAFFVSCAGGEGNNSKNTPVLVGPPNTTFPMPPPSGKSLGELGWQLADGQRNEFSQYKGSVLVLDFYATWCLPCRESIPHLVQLQQSYKDKGLRVVGLNVGGPEDWPKVEAFARELKIQYTLAVPEDELSSFLLSDSQDIPQTFVFDREGRIKQRLIGFGDGDEELIRNAVESALQGK